MHLIPGLRWNHLVRKEGHQMPLAQIIRDQLTENSTNSIAGCVRLNLDLIFRIELVEDQNLEERLPQFGKC